jgi:hypothetical protein
MSGLDSIVDITISTNSLQILQAGFGVPLIIARHELGPERVKVFGDSSELPKELSANSQVVGMVKALMEQEPKVPKFKIGRRLANESITDAFRAITNETSDFYGVLLACDDAKTYGVDLKLLVDAIGNRRFLLGSDLVEADLGVAVELTKQKRKRVFCMYKSKPEEYPAAAWMGKMLPQAPGSASWAYKELTGLTPSQYSTELLAKLETSNTNRYLHIKGRGVTLDGKVSEGEYIDIIHGIDWLHVRMQERLFKLLMVNPKIPYTLKGIDLVRCEIMAQLKEAVYRGLLAADPEPQVSIPNIEDIDPDYRGKRILPDVKFFGRLAGAIHHIKIQGTVTI